MNYTKTLTKLKYEISGTFYNVFMSQGGSRKTYFVFFQNRNLWYKVSGKECISK